MLTYLLWWLLVSCAAKLVLDLAILHLARRSAGPARIATGLQPMCVLIPCFNEEQVVEATIPLPCCAHVTCASPA